MPDALPLTGLFGKVPAHGDFVRRGLPTSFVGPWDAWLQAGMESTRALLGERWAAAWDGAPPWRFALPAGACGPDAVVGVMLPSQDMVGRRFPITLAMLLPAGTATPPGEAWFTAVEAAARAGRDGRCDADALAAAIPRGDGDIAPLPPADDLPGLVAAPVGELPAEPAGDVLDLFTQPPRPSTPDDAPGWGIAAGEPPGADVQDRLGEAGAPDGTLAFLLGEGASAAPPTLAEPEADPLAALIAAGGAPQPAPPPHLSAAIEDAPPPAMPEDEALPVLMAAAAPPPPAGGGWWTGGGGRFPPSVRAWPALLPAAEFASLLEAEA